MNDERDRVMAETITVAKTYKIKVDRAALDYLDQEDLPQADLLAAAAHQSEVGSFSGVLYLVEDVNELTGSTRLIWVTQMDAEYYANVIFSSYYEVEETDFIVD